MQDYRDNIEIDLKDLFKYLCKYWLFILLGILVGAIIGGGYGVNVSKKAEVELTREDYRGKLTENEALGVEMLYNAYNEYQKLYETLQDDDTADYMARFELIESAQQLLGGYNSFSNDQKSYYESLVNEEVGLGTDADSSTADTNAALQSDKGSAIKISSRYVLIGAFLGAFVVMGIYAMLYILSPTVKTADDIRAAFRLPVIGTLVSDGAKNLSLVTATILASTRKEQANRIFFISSSEDTISKKMMDSIQENMKKAKGVTVISEMNALTDTSVAESITDKDAVVLFERTRASRYEDIAHEVELCYNYGIKILGMIVID